MTHQTYAMSHSVEMHNVPVYSVGQVRQSPASQTAGRRFENSPVSEHSSPPTSEAQNSPIQHLPQDPPGAWQLHIQTQLWSELLSQ